MSFIKASYRIPEDEELRKQLLDTVEQIVSCVAEKSADKTVVRFPEKDHVIAFGGTTERPELCLTLEWQKCAGKPCLFASIDDKFIWQEWDFGTRELFVSQIANFIVKNKNQNK